MAGNSMRKSLATFCFTLILTIGLCACGQEMPTWQEQYDLGVRYLSEGNYEEAIIAFTAAIEIDPNQAPAYVGRGDTYVASGETEETLAAAQADYEKAIELDEALVSAYLGLADVYIRQGDYESVWNILNEALKSTNRNQAIADKIAEIKKGTYTDSTGNIRRRNRYSVEGDLESYVLYSYDALGRRSSWENWSFRDENGGGLRLTAQMESRCIVTFNEEGLPEKNQFYDEKGNPTSYDSITYNEKGQKVEQHRYSADGSEEAYFYYYYDSAGRQSKYEGYAADGTMYSYWVSDYDEDGKRIRETKYNADGSVDGYSLFE